SAGPMYGAAALPIAMRNFLVGNRGQRLDSFRPLAVVRAIEPDKSPPTVLARPMLDAIVSLPDEKQQQYDGSSMKTVIAVGAPLLNKTKQQKIAYFKNADLNEFYGASEHGGSTNLFPEYMEKKERSVGLPMLGMEVALLDEEGNKVKQGDVGEIFVKG